MDGSTTVGELVTECVIRGKVGVIGKGSPLLVLVALYKDADFYSRLIEGVEEAGKSTSPEVATIAARGLADPASLTETEIQAVCWSALGQVESEGGE